jgi:hypothetical protein
MGFGVNPHKALIPFLPHLVVMSGNIVGHLKYLFPRVQKGLNIPCLEEMVGRNTTSISNRAAGTCRVYCTFNLSFFQASSKICQ